MLGLVAVLLAQQCTGFLPAARRGSLATPSRASRERVIASVEDDNTNPCSQQVWFQEQLPGCKRLHFPAEGWGHFSYAMAGTMERAWDVILRADEPSHTPSIVAAPSQGILKDTAKKQRNPLKNRTNV